MDWYIRTSIQSKTVEEILKKYLFFYKPYVRISPKLVDYLEENYKLNLNYVLKELINNSLYAKASRIDINFIPSECDQDSVNFRPVEKIEIIDDGHGVSFSDFKKSIMEIATDAKTDGYGVGRFSALQIGRKMCYEK